MTETLEEIKARARAMRNQHKTTNTAFVKTDPHNNKSGRGGKKGGSQTTQKSARKPSV